MGSLSGVKIILLFRAWSYGISVKWCEEFLNLCSYVVGGWSRSFDVSQLFSEYCDAVFQTKRDKE